MKGPASVPDDLTRRDFLNTTALTGAGMLLGGSSAGGAPKANDADGHATIRRDTPALDMAPFALPGTPANEVRFEDPREVREVIVTLKSAAPSNLGLSYLHKTWRRKRQESLDPTINTFQMGWKVIDDWFDLSWDKGVVRVEKRGSRTAVLRFDWLSKEGVPFKGSDVDYRYTLGIRVDGVAREAVERIEVRTASRPSRTQIRVVLDAGKPVTVREIALSGHNCEIARLTAETGTKRLSGARVRLLDGPPARRSFLVDVRHLVSSHRFAHDEGLITFGLAEKTFTVSLDALRTSGPIWYEDGGVFVTLASDSPTRSRPTSVKYAAAPAPRKSAGRRGSRAPRVAFSPWWPRCPNRASAGSSRANPSGNLSP